MAEFPAMPLWTDAYLADTGHLTTLEHGAYLLLLMTMWRANGRLPNDDRKLARFARLTPGQWRRVKPTLMEFFKVRGDEITQGRLTDELIVVRQNSRKQSDRARSRWLKEKGSPDAAAVPDDCRSDAPTPTPTPIYGGGGSAHAREAVEDDPAPFGKPEAIDLARIRDAVLEAAGIDITKDQKPARWLGSESLHVIGQWLELGLTEGEIVETVREVIAGKRDGPPKTLSYFSEAMQRRAGRKHSPPLTPIDGGRHDGSAGQSTRERRAEEKLRRDLAFADDLDRQRGGG